MLLICQSSGWKKINLEHGRVGNLVKTPRVESSLKFYESRTAKIFDDSNDVL